MKMLIAKDMFNPALPIVLEKDVVLFQYECFSRGYHAYMDKWTPLIGESLKGHRGANNGHHKQTVAITRRNLFHGKEIAGHLPLNISKVISCF